MSTIPQGIPIHCALCGANTIMAETKRCDRCWELETRMRADPIIARKIMDMMEAERKKL